MKRNFRKRVKCVLKKLGFHGRMFGVCLMYLNINLVVVSHCQANSKWWFPFNLKFTTILYTFVSIIEHIIVLGATLLCETCNIYFKFETNAQKVSVFCIPGLWNALLPIRLWSMILLLANKYRHTAEHFQDQLGMETFRLARNLPRQSPTIYLKTYWFRVRNIWPYFFQSPQYCIKQDCCFEQITSPRLCTLTNKTH